MGRTALTDGSGAWFLTESAVLFREQTKFDGRNQISVPTGSQWEHEYLYFTKSGKWVQNCWSNYQGRGESYSQIDEATAIAWLIQNECFDRGELEELPKSIQDAVKAGFEAAEI